MKDGSGKVWEFASMADKKGMGVPGLMVLPMVLPRVLLMALTMPMLVVLLLTMVLLLLVLVQDVEGGSWESTDLFLLENSFSSRSMCLSSLLAIVDVV